MTRELADVAEAIVVQVADDQWRRRVKRYGLPRRQEDGKRAHWAIIALGKLGGRELNYHSDLDLVFVYDSDGMTSGGVESIPNAQFFTDVAKWVLRAFAGTPETGRLYSVDTRLRPHGNSGPLAIPIDALIDYFQHSAQTWERLALTRARVIHARGGFGRQVETALRDALLVPVEPQSLARDVVAMRRRLEESRGPNDLKRGFGGLADIEFLVQYLQLRHADHPEVARTNLWEALDALLAAGFVSAEAHHDLREAYDFVRTVEGRLRIVHNRAAVDWPGRPDELARLARRLNYDPPAPPDAVLAFQADAARLASRTRALFEEYLGKNQD